MRKSASNDSGESPGGAAAVAAPPAYEDHRGSSVENYEDADKALAALGYTAVFKREFSMWSCFSFALSISGLYGTVITTYTYGLYAGGGASIVWAWLIGGIGAMCLALSIAEITSAYPTSGGMYFTLKFLAPRSRIPVIAWLVGWLNLIGQICGTASSEYSAAQLLLAAVSVASDFSYIPTQGHIVGVVAALTILHGMINSLPTLWLHRIATSYAVLHLSVLLAACITLLAMQKDKSLGVQALSTIQSAPSSGWTPPGFSFLFGFLGVAWSEHISHCEQIGALANGSISNDGL
jgi:amino acid transporter